MGTGAHRHCVVPVGGFQSLIKQDPEQPCWISGGDPALSRLDIPKSLPTRVIPRSCLCMGLLSFNQLQPEEAKFFTVALNSLSTCRAASPERAFLSRQSQTHVGVNQHSHAQGTPVTKLAGLRHTRHSDAYGEDANAFLLVSVRRKMLLLAAQSLLCSSCCLCPALAGRMLPALLPTSSAASWAFLASLSSKSRPILGPGFIPSFHKLLPVVTAQQVTLHCNEAAPQTASWEAQDQY